MIDRDAVKAGRGLTERSACNRLAIIASAVPAHHAIVELGAFRGRTTAWLALGAERGKGATVTAVDPWTYLVTPEVSGYLEIQYERGDYSDPDTLLEFGEHMDRCNVKDYRWFQGTALEAAENWTGPPVGLLFHDALHTADHVEADLAAWMPHMAPHSMVAAHDVSEKRFGVFEGAERILPAAGYLWPPKIHRWKKHPNRRGLMVAYR